MLLSFPLFLLGDGPKAHQKNKPNGGADARKLLLYSFCLLIMRADSQLGPWLAGSSPPLRNVTPSQPDVPELQGVPFRRACPCVCAVDAISIDRRRRVVQ